MCKLFAIVEVENQKNAEVFTKCAIPLITKTDNHGLGIMRLGENGTHIQRWLTPPTVVTKRTSKKMAKYQKALKYQRNEEGTPSKHLYSIAVHGRFATCEQSIENTHPFYKDGSALMHNGIISNASQFERTLSTCDSEALLSQYLKHDVRSDTNNLTKSLDKVAGYYAAIVFNDNGTIDIWRDGTATLFLAHVRDVGVVIATTVEIITGAAKACKATLTGIDELLPNTTIRWTKGIFPRISTFESYDPPFVTTQTAFYSDGVYHLGHHQNSTSDASGFGNDADAYEKHWWELEDLEERELKRQETEAQRILDWEEQEAEDLADLEKLYDQKRRDEALKLKKVTV